MERENHDHPLAEQGHQGDKNPLDKGTAEVKVIEHTEAEGYTYVKKLLTDLKYNRHYDDFVKMGINDAFFTSNSDLAVKLAGSKVTEKTIKEIVNYVKNKDCKKYKLKIMSLNCGLMPPRVPGIQKQLQRAEAIGNKIIKEVLPDIVCLQEVFNEQAATIISNIIRPHLPNQKINVGTNRYFIGVNSGLFIASVYPIIRSHFKEFPTPSGVDFMARKGLLGVTLDLGDDDVVCVFTTHMQAGGESYFWKTVRGTKQQIRKNQVDWITKLIDKYVKNETKKVRAVFFGGDLNVRSESDEYKVMTTLLSKLHAVDLYLHDEECQFTGTNWVNYVLDDPNPKPHAKRIDYIFSLYDKDVSGSSTILSFGTASDHLSVCADLLITCHDTAFVAPIIHTMNEGSTSANSGAPRSPVIYDSTGTHVLSSSGSSFSSSSSSSNSYASPPGSQQYLSSSNP